MTETLILQHYVGGAWMVGETAGRQVSPSNPDDFQVLWPSADAALVATAADAASGGARALRTLGPEGRADLLERIARGKEDRLEPLARLAARETGKTLHLVRWLGRHPLSDIPTRVR